MSYVIVTDSCGNLPEYLIDSLELRVLPLSFMIEDKQYFSYVKGEVTDLKKFFTMMREGKLVTTSLPNMADSEAVLREILSQGQDVLYLGFSSGLSGTYQATHLLMEELKAEYPDRTLIDVDTLAASGGEGLLVKYAGEMRKAGKAIEDVAKWVEDNKLKLAHWFTVDDLMFLFRGGRVSRTAAWAGTILSIKPVLHVDDEGHLIPMGKVKGRKKSIKALFEQMQKTVEEPVSEQCIIITHGDCEEEAQHLADMIENEWHPREIILNCLDPVIGAHAGPGTIALFYLASSRNY